MSGYIMLINLTDQGVKSVKDSPKRQTKAKALAKNCGVKLKGISMTLGAFDFVCTLDADSDDAVARFALALGSLGNVRTTTLRCFTEQEGRKILASLP